MRLLVHCSTELERSPASTFELALSAVLNLFAESTYGELKQALCGVRLEPNDYEKRNEKGRCIITIL